MKKIKYLDIVNHFKKFSIEVSSNISLEKEFIGISSIDKSSINEISFFQNEKYLDKLKNTKSSACLINKKFQKYLPNTCDAILVDNPYYALGTLGLLFSNSNILKSNGIISKNISLDSKSIIENNVQIDNFTAIVDSKVSKGVKIGSNCNIGPNVIIKENSIIESNVSISNAIIQENVYIKSGARIGGDGFGFDEKTKQKIIHYGNVLIMKNSHIGSNTTIDRAVFDSTIIGEFCHIDNLVQIAHNVVIGNHGIIAAQVGIAGSATIGNFIKIGGKAGISGHINIGDNVTIAAKSGVTKNINHNMTVAGFPAKDIKQWKLDLIKSQNKK